MKNLYPTNIKKFKNLLCLVVLLLLGFFTLKYFNLIEGMSDDTDSTTDISVPEENNGGRGPGGGRGGGPGAGGGPGGGPGAGGGPGGGPGADGGGEDGDNYGDGNYTVHVNIQAPKMANLKPSPVTEEEDTPST